MFRCAINLCVSIRLSFYLELYDNETNSVLLGKTARIFFEVLYPRAFRYEYRNVYLLFIRPQKIVEEILQLVF